MYKVSLKNPKAPAATRAIDGTFLAAQKTPPAKMRGPKFAGRGSRMEEVQNNDFTDLEMAGCDGHHIKTDPAGNRHKETASCGGAMKATPDSLHVISFRESETADCDGQHRPPLA